MRPETKIAILLATLFFGLGLFASIDLAIRQSECADLGGVLVSSVCIDRVYTIVP